MKPLREQVHHLLKRYGLVLFCVVELHRLKELVAIFTVNVDIDRTEHFSNLGDGNTTLSGLFGARKGLPEVFLLTGCEGFAGCRHVLQSRLGRAKVQQDNNVLQSSVGLETPTPIVVVGGHVQIVRELQRHTLRECVVLH